MSWLVTDRQNRVRVVATVLILAAIAGVFLLASAVAEHVQDGRDDAERREQVQARQDRFWRSEVKRLQQEQRDLVSYFEGQGKVVPSNLGGSGPPVTVIRDDSDDDDGSSDTTRIIEHTTPQTTPSSPTTTTPPAADEPQPSPRVVEIPQIPMEPIEDVKDSAGELLKGTPLDGLL